MNQSEMDMIERIFFCNGQLDGGGRLAEFVDA